MKSLNLLAVVYRRVQVDGGVRLFAIATMFWRLRRAHAVDCRAGRCSEPEADGGCGLEQTLMRSHGGHDGPLDQSSHVFAAARRVHGPQGLLEAVGSHAARFGCGE